MDDRPHYERMRRVYEARGDSLGPRSAPARRRQPRQERVPRQQSHELRTPLNSSLILATLLSENKAGDLTAEQVRYAGSISSADNELLALINDVLDFAKIEAGRIDLDVEPVVIPPAREPTKPGLSGQARAKHLMFSRHAAGSSLLPKARVSID